MNAARTLRESSAGNPLLSSNGECRSHKENNIVGFKEHTLVSENLKNQGSMEGLSAASSSYWKRSPTLLRITETRKYSTLALETILSSIRSSSLERATTMGSVSDIQWVHGSSPLVHRTGSYLKTDGSGSEDGQMLSPPVNLLQAESVMRRSSSAHAVRMPLEDVTAVSADSTRYTSKTISAKHVVLMALSPLHNDVNENKGRLQRKPSVSLCAGPPNNYLCKASSCEHSSVKSGSFPDDPADTAVSSSCVNAEIHSLGVSAPLSAQMTTDIVEELINDSAKAVVPREKVETRRENCVTRLSSFIESEWSNQGTGGRPDVFQKRLQLWLWADRMRACRRKDPTMAKKFNKHSLRSGLSKHGVKRQKMGCATRYSKWFCHLNAGGVRMMMRSRKRLEPFHQQRPTPRRRAGSTGSFTKRHQRHSWPSSGSTLSHLYQKSAARKRQSSCGAVVTQFFSTSWSDDRESNSRKHIILPSTAQPVIHMIPCLAARNNSRLAQRHSHKGTFKRSSSLAASFPQLRRRLTINDTGCCSTAYSESDPLRCRISTRQSRNSGKRRRLSVDDDGELTVGQRDVVELLPVYLAAPRMLSMATTSGANGRPIGTTLCPLRTGAPVALKSQRSRAGLQNKEESQSISKLANMVWGSVYRWLRTG